MKKIFLTLTLIIGIYGFPVQAQTESPATNAASNTETPKTYECVPAIKIVIDLGYCFGFTMSYYEAINDQQTLTAIAEGNVRKNIENAHNQCYPTRFDDQITLGELAFSSYINLKDDRLLKDSASHCQTLMQYYAQQNTN